MSRGERSEPGPQSPKNRIRHRKKKNYFLGVVSRETAFKILFFFRLNNFFCSSRSLRFCLSTAFKVSLKAVNCHATKITKISSTTCDVFILFPEKVPAGQETREKDCENKEYRDETIIVISILIVWRGWSATTIAIGKSRGLRYSTSNQRESTKE